jgi:hypothetical protein
VTRTLPEVSDSSAGPESGAAARHDWFARLRAEWFRRLRPVGSWVPWELRGLVELDEAEEDAAFWGAGLLHPAPQLRAEHLQRCVVVPDRIALLEHLPHDAVVAEVGTLHGDFAREILRVTHPRELHLIDHDAQPRARALAEEPEHGGRVHVHQRDSVEALESFPDGWFDWIYIDAQHAYDGVKRDIEAARRKVKRDGLLVFNDYTVWSWVEMQPYGVVAAVNELCLEDGWEMLFLTLPAHMYCDVVLRRMDA